MIAAGRFGNPAALSTWVPIAPSAGYPGLALDLRGQGALQSGAGVALSSVLNVVRATTAMDEYSDGSLVSVGTNVARYGGGQGLMIERGATNSIRNSTNVGAASGSPGTLPTNWSVTTAPTGLTRTITTSTVNGYSVTGINYAGTTSSTSSFQFQWESITAVAAAVGQVWTNTIGFSMPVDDAAITSVLLETWEYDAGSTFLSTGSNVNLYTNRSTFARRSRTTTLAQATTAFISPRLRTNSIASGTPINVTFWISAPQLETGPKATAFIPTSTVAVTRNSDQIKITGSPLTAGIGAGTAFTIFAEYEAYVSADPSYIAAIANDGAPDFNNSIWSSLNTSRQATGTSTSAGVSQFTNAATGISAPPTLNRLAMRFGANDAAISHNGAAAITDATITLPVGAMTRLVLGSAVTSPGVQALNGRLTRFAAWPSLLSNADLVALST